MSSLMLVPFAGSEKALFALLALKIKRPIMLPQDMYLESTIVIGSYPFGLVIANMTQKEIIAVCLLAFFEVIPVTCQRVQFFVTDFTLFHHLHCFGADNGNVVLLDVLEVIDHTGQLLVAGRADCSSTMGLLLMNAKMYS